MILHMQLPINPTNTGQADIPKQRNIQRLGIIQELHVLRREFIRRACKLELTRLFHPFHGFPVLSQHRKQVNILQSLHMNRIDTCCDYPVFSQVRIA